jgi:RNA polymerase sigma-70 factor (ECF subfamily)
VTPADTRAEEFEALRPRLFGIAYRMTGSVGDAEDACQDAWLRWQRVDRATVDNPEAYLVRVVTRLSLDRLHSAQRRREAYVGPYLPEPLVADDDTGQPESAAELADSLTFAFLVLLDELTPRERAVLLLHDVFGYPFDEIAPMLDLSPAACRQLASRTRRKLDHERDGLRRPDEAREQELIGQLMATIASGDVDAVMRLLAPDVVLLSDGGPSRHAARRPIVGPDRVARLVVSLARRLSARATAHLVHVNGEPGVLFTADGEPDLTLSFVFTPDGRVRRLFSQLNPDKLRHVHWTPNEQSGPQR